MAIRQRICAYINMAKLWQAESDQTTLSRLAASCRLHKKVESVLAPSWQTMADTESCQQRRLSVSARPQNKHQSPSRTISGPIKFRLPANNCQTNSIRLSLETSTARRSRRNRPTPAPAGSGRPWPRHGTAGRIDPTAGEPVKHGQAGTN